MPPVRGPTWPIFTSLPPPLPLGPQPTVTRAAATAATMAGMPNWMLFMKSPRGSIRYCRRRISYSGNAAENQAHFCERIHFTSVLMSASGTALLGGIGIVPHTP